MGITAGGAARSTIVGGSHRVLRLLNFVGPPLRLPNFKMAGSPRRSPTLQLCPTINNRGSRDISIRSRARVEIPNNRRESTEYRSAILADSCRATPETGK